MARLLVVTTELNMWLTRIRMTTTPRRFLAILTTKSLVSYQNNRLL
jgi:hypothetical protein